MKKLLLACALIMISAASSFAQEHSGLSVEQAHAYATAKSQKNGAVFLTIENTGGLADALIDVQSNVAERIELHTHITEGDTMKMRKVERVEIPANTQHMLNPMGDHIMLMGLNEPLQKGAVFPLVLSFEKAGRKEISVEVVAPGQTLARDTPSAHHGHDHDHGMMDAPEAMDTQEKTGSEKMHMHETHMHETEMHGGHDEKHTDH
mgnify:CR=1 FL=1